MSAWRVEEEHIDLILTQAVMSEFVSQSVDMDKIGQVLLIENYRSVDFRYTESVPVPDYRFCRFPYEFSRYDAVLAMVSYRYQSCEHPQWRNSVAYRFIGELIGYVKTLYDDRDREEEVSQKSDGWCVCIGLHWRGVPLADYRSMIPEEQ